MAIKSPFVLIIFNSIKNKIYYELLKKQDNHT